MKRETTRIENYHDALDLFEAAHARAVAAIDEAVAAGHTEAEHFKEWLRASPSYRGNGIESRIGHAGEIEVGQWANGREVFLAIQDRRRAGIVVYNAYNALSEDEKRDAPQKPDADFLTE
jgi:hypothetical protein